MSLQQAVHSKWAANPAVLALVPAERLFTGQVPSGVGLPYASVTTPKEGLKEYTALNNYLETVTLRVSVFAASLAEAIQVRQAADDALHHQSLTPSVGTVLSVSRSGGGQS
ncbi:MAG: DUF3168 domain-containing protein, partial [Planctomycetales bacterium]